MTLPGVQELELKQAADPNLAGQRGGRGDPAEALAIAGFHRAGDRPAERTSDLLELVGMADPDMESSSPRPESIQEELDRLEQTLLSGEHDANNAIVEINAGAGGTESCDWALILQRMYLRWAQEKVYKVEIIDEVPGEVAGIKSVTFEVIGPNAFGG